MVRVIAQLALVVLMLATLTCTSPQRNTASRKPFQLRVSLYPWLPSADSFSKWLEADFEGNNPDIDLVLRPLSRSTEGAPDYMGDLSYDVDKAVTALATDGEDSQHIVEVDTMILGELIKRKSVVPFDPVQASFLPAAAEAVTWQGTRYGVPHWTCGYFVISERPDVRSAHNLSSLLATLRAAGTNRVDVVGDLDGSWDSIMLYLDSFRDTYPEGDLQAALARPDLDPTVEKSFASLGTACIKDGKSFCGKDGVDTFASGSSDALIGYSERLHPIIEKARSKAKQLHIGSAVLGNGDRPMLFTDALVLSPRCSEKRCQDAASRFAADIVSNRVFEVALMSLDAGTNATPRYLLPATDAALGFGKIATDPLYQQLTLEIKDARSFPNHGVPEAKERGTIRARLRTVLRLGE